jgi:hypothetical protein
LIKDIFSQVNSIQRVKFKIHKATGAVYLKAGKFLTSEGLRWRFNALQGVKCRVEDFSFSGEPWILVW